MAKPMEAKKLMLSLVSNCCRNDICLAREKKQKRHLKVREGTSEWKEAEVRHFFTVGGESAGA
jgi:hypothetical protein